MNILDTALLNTIIYKPFTAYIIYFIRYDESLLPAEVYSSSCPCTRECCCGWFKEHRDIKGAGWRDTVIIIHHNCNKAHLNICNGGALAPLGLPRAPLLRKSCLISWAHLKNHFLQLFLVKFPIWL